MSDRCDRTERFANSRHPFFLPLPVLRERAGVRAIVANQSALNLTKHFHQPHDDGLHTSQDDHPASPIQNRQPPIAPPQPDSQPSPHRQHHHPILLRHHAFEPPPPRHRLPHRPHVPRHPGHDPRPAP